MDCAMTLLYRCPRAGLPPVLRAGGIFRWEDAMADEKPKQPWTPGQWELFGGRLIRAVNRHVATPLAETITPFSSVLDPSPDLAAEHANGVIMAAAPELAEALAKFVLGYEHALRRRGDKTAPADPPVIASARAALDACGWQWGGR